MKTHSWRIAVLSFAVCCVIGFTQYAQADTTVGDNNSYIIQVDTDDLGGGFFTVEDFDGGNPTVTVINADALTTTLNSTTTNVTGTLSVTGTTLTNGINNGGDGITNAGTVAGVTTLTASSTVSAGALSTSGTLGVTGTTTLTGALTANGGAAINNGTVLYSGAGIGNALVVDGTSARLGNTTNTNSVAVNSTNTTVTGTTLINGATTITSPNTAHSLSVTDTTTTVNGGATIYSGVGTGNSLAVGATAVNATVGNNSLDIDGATDTIALYADNDALTTNARGGLVITPTSVQMGTRTDSGDDRGLWINPTETVLTGGTGTSAMTLDDDGATFSDLDTGAPITVTGVANASSDFDAVNYKQFKNLRDKAYSGIASVAALAAIPAPMAGKNYSIGAGFGNYSGENAVALGGKANLGGNVSLAAGLGYTGDDFTTNVGVGYSW